MATVEPTNDGFAVASRKLHKNENRPMCMTAGSSGTAKPYNNQACTLKNGQTDCVGILLKHCEPVARGTRSEKKTSMYLVAFWLFYRNQP